MANQPIHTVVVAVLTLQQRYEPDRGICPDVTWDYKAPSHPQNEK